MITPSNLKRIHALPADQPVLMAVVHVNPTDHDNHGDAFTTRVKGALGDLGVPPTLAPSTCSTTWPAPASRATRAPSMYWARA